MTARTFTAVQAAILAAFVAVGGTLAAALAWGLLGEIIYAAR